MAYPADLVRTKDWGNEILTDSDLEGQLDLIIDWVMAAMDNTTGHSHDATSNEGPKIVLTGGVSGILPIANGGTGQATDIMETMMPVGTIYSNKAVSTNPATLFGFGTWVAIEGECIVGLVAGGEFDTLGSVPEGETTHTLTKAEIPTHVHTYTENTGAAAGTGAGSNVKNALSTSNTGDGSADSLGSGAHNNIQPSHVAYVWERTV